MDEILQLILMTMVPFLELRASIPFGILILSMDWIPVFIVCVISNIILGMILFPFIQYIVDIATRIRFIDNIYKRYVARTQQRIKKYVDKYGWLGVAIFIGVPLPGSGVYSGSLGAYLIGLQYKRFIIANIIGVIIAGVIVTIASLFGGALAFIIK